jgi:hypothetical protein
MFDAMPAAASQRPTPMHMSLFLLIGCTLFFTAPARQSRMTCGETSRRWRNKPRK